MEPDDVELEDISSGHDEVGYGAYVAAVGQVGVEVIGLYGRNSGGEVGAGVDYEPGSAVLDTRRPVQHFVGREAHLGLLLGFVHRQREGGGERKRRRKESQRRKRVLGFQKRENCGGVDA